VALLWRCVTLWVRRDDEPGRQSLARGEPFALGVVQAASMAAARSGCKMEISAEVNSNIWISGE